MSTNESQLSGSDGPAARPLRAVLVSYVFPPAGGAGVQRIAKLARYLPDHGVVPTVLTCRNPSAPVKDASLLRDLSADLEVIRVNTLEPGYEFKKAAWRASADQGAGLKVRARHALVNIAKNALMPDPQLLWQPAAGWALAKLLRTHQPDVVLISGPPFSSFLLAPVAQLRRTTAVVLDYRDEWSTYRTSYEMMPTSMASLMSKLERALLRSADAVVTATRSFRTQLLRHHPFLDPTRAWAIPNGYDPADVPLFLPSPPADRLVVTYAGTVFRLTSARGFLDGVRWLHATEPVLARQLDVRFFGRIVDTEMDAFEGMEALGVTRCGYVDHERVLKEIAASHFALCLLDDVPGVERIYPAKIFEIMHLRCPVLALTPPGELSTLVSDHALGEVLAPRDAQGIAEFLARKLRQLQQGKPLPRSEPVGAQRYDRRSLAGEFARVFQHARQRG